MAGHGSRKCEVITLLLSLLRQEPKNIVKITHWKHRIQLLGHIKADWSYAYVQNTFRFIFHVGKMKIPGRKKEAFKDR